MKTPTKQTVYFPKDGRNTVFRPIDLPIEKTIRKEGYFFTPEQLNEYTRNVIRQALETAAKKVKDEIACDLESTVHYRLTVKPSIANTFEETYKKFEV